MARVVGRGRNRWSTVHVDDRATLHGRALGHETAAGFFSVENGEASPAEIGGAVARRLGLGEVQLPRAGQSASRP